MARKVFLSVLGSTNYTECNYTSVDKDFKSEPVRFIQEAMLNYHQAKNWEANSKGYVFVTEKEDGSKQKNWFDNGHVDYKTRNPLQCEGLEKRLKKMNLPFDIKPIEIPIGNTEHEIWKVFIRIYKILEKDDEVYFDITHGFRFMPMLVLVLCNYSKFLKNIVVKHISYGNYEGRNKETNEAPIIDLTSLSNLQDWTNGVNQFKSNGSVKGLLSLMEENELSSAISDFADSFAGSRGIDIWEGTSSETLSDQLQKYDIEKSPPPFIPIFSSFINEVEKFTKGNIIEKGISAVHYCKEHNLIQQGITLLSELIVTYILLYLGFEDWKNNFLRTTATNCLNIKSKENYHSDTVMADLANKLAELNISRDEYDYMVETHNKFVDQYYALKHKTTIGKNLFISLHQGSRNDINHAGVRHQPKSTQSLRKSLDKYLARFENLYKEYPCS